MPENLPDPLAVPSFNTVGQLLIVEPTPAGGTSSAKVRTLERGQTGWRPLSEWPAVVGAAGFADEGAKREGDQKTPSGLFRLDYVFGYASSAQTRMPYRQATPADKFVDDSTSPQYNRWVQGAADAKRFEAMRRADGLYEYGIVIRYNMDPVVPGRGSAIFFHIWPGPDGQTAGCIALEKSALRQIISWLDPTRNPHTLLGSGGHAALLHSD